MVSVSAALLNWYDLHQRILPWRAREGEQAEPYSVWLSEVMLQQTTVASVIPYFKIFIERWPNVESLAVAPLEEILEAWAGLGYYARARNLHACAQQVLSLHGGQFPDSEQELRQLKGIGDYTAAAIAAIAFNKPAAVVDGNIERVITRLFKIEEPLPGAKKAIKQEVARITPHNRAGDFAQAMMDLGALVCTPKNPVCLHCPLRSYCKAYADLGSKGVIALPKKMAKKLKPTRRGLVFWLENKTQGVAMRRRPQKGLLGGMLEFPGSDWLEDPNFEVQSVSCPWPGPLESLETEIKHSFTHFHLLLQPLRGRLDEKDAEQLKQKGFKFYARTELETMGLATLMRKVTRAVL